MGARAYNTITGRFSQVDPIPGGSANAYDCAAQNPVVKNDVTGKAWVAISYWVDEIRYVAACLPGRPSSVECSFSYSVYWYVY
jgi:hypothetical protein